ncbi:putative adenosine deaminase-related growth factor [Podospora australis]|uniref:adenosine deaminase n=1 Tax=Podospora australis TaxID=1536484 RepID=A0AAN7ALU4_9PEZI|nr:putative adenosine deaminase-related growth factor [Podospora australis]
MTKTRQTAKEYELLRKTIQKSEDVLSFDYALFKTATDVERQANEKLKKLREDDTKYIYNKAESRKGYRGQLHPRFYGDHFLSNADIIEQTRLFQLCRAMPKGAHLHIHFNANLLPNFLLDIAKTVPTMYMWSNVRLVDDQGNIDATAMDRCRIQFSVLSDEKVRDERGQRSVFDRSYKEGEVMKFETFLEQFGARYKTETVDKWLQDKLVFQEEEAYGLLQTSAGAWEKFNARTQMMKGLFNYRTAYIRYTKKCLEEFADDNIQYAEIRPNFMATNQVWRDDGTEKIDNHGIMELIIDAYHDFQNEHKQKVVKGLKIIYCTPRSFKPEQVETSLMECLEFKLTPKFSKFIAGYDLVGEEGKGRPLKDFRDQFIHFKKACQQAGQDIPFLFHCGETLDIGTETDGNLYDALLLGSKRIGHGFALPRHPYVMEQMKKQGVCVEVCPISNEILGLTPRISGHSVYNLLANNVHCTVSTDNGTLFRSRLSHDFYQVIAGKADMTLYGLRQLIEWSIEHSCMDDAERKYVFDSWKEMWARFCQQIVDGEFDHPESQSYAPDQGTDQAFPGKS